MATDITKDTLVGSLSSMGLVSDSDIDDAQEFAFPGLDGSFNTTLGFKGRNIVFSGIMRFSGASLAASRAALQTQLTTIRDYKRLGTELNVFQNGDTSSIAGLYEDSVDGVVVKGFQHGKAAKSGTSTVIITLPYTLVLRKLT